MTLPSFRTLITPLVPQLLLLLTTLLVLALGRQEAWLAILIRILPYAVLVTGFLFGWRFNRSRLVFGVLVLFLADRFLFHLPAGPESYSSRQLFLVNAAGLLLPVNLLLFSLFKERGLFSGRGPWRLGFLVLQPALVGLFYQDDPAHLAAIITYPLFPWPATGLGLGHSALLVILLAFLALLVRYLRSKGPIDQGFLHALLLIFLGLGVTGSPSVQALLLAAAGLALLLAAVEDAHAMAFKDELTGLPARRALNETFLQLKGNYTVAMLDIDFFKKFNDTYGHEVGDQVLRMVAVKLSKVTGGGRAFRYGGEEFTILFPGKALEEAALHLEDVRKTIEEAGFHVRDKKSRKKSAAKNRQTGSRKVERVSVTISIGAAQNKKGRSAPAEIMKAADQALYKAKELGRNRLELAK